MSDFFTHSIDIPADHPCFEGHFPGFPVFPAVAQLSLLTEAIAILHGGRCVIAAIASAKFLSPLGPGATVIVELRQRGDNSIDFVIRTAALVVAKGKLTYRMVEP
ncbi:MAG: hypothetical protein AUJ57_03150 [Zetaproteobacteria bacterium CG1_02_53_45]|nr:MAG: hypothetical protein AUJ57_03150 [Zetaproteobacteria bacterium CG1_02_53_45]